MTTVDHHLMHPFYMVPNEIWVEVGEYITLDRDKLVLLRVSRHIHDIAGYLLYRKIILYGSRASACLSMLATRSALATFYSSQIRDLSLHASSSAEKYLCFPVLARVMPDLSNLLRLSISCLPKFTSYLFLCLERTGMIRGSDDFTYLAASLKSGSKCVSRLSLPSLHTLVLDCGSDLFPLAHFRNLTRFESTLLLSYETLGLLLSNARGRRMARTMEELLIRLDSNLAIDQVLLLVGGTFTRLRILGIEQSKLRAQLTLKSLIYYAVLPKLQVLLLNVSDVWPFRWHESSSDSHYPAMAPFFDTLSACREPLTYRLHAQELELENYVKQADASREGMSCIPCRQHSLKCVGRGPVCWSCTYLGAKCMWPSGDNNVEQSAASEEPIVDLENPDSSQHGQYSESDFQQSETRQYLSDQQLEIEAFERVLAYLPSRGRNDMVLTPEEDIEDVTAALNMSRAQKRELTFNPT
ncbi:hypothetical protein BKA70DRAFT_1426169 [Coprinopsis sp. MPI-PUGE-AT-0042]|nr:hypothetical protein BKA70DRAFT_1426169 [Coprinopsis sp. MPI-PUGE-AT-0042]